MLQLEETKSKMEKAFRDRCHTILKLEKLKHDKFHLDLPKDEENGMIYHIWSIFTKPLQMFNDLIYSEKDKERCQEWR